MVSAQLSTAPLNRRTAWATGISTACGALALPPFDCSGFAWFAPALLLLAVRDEAVGSAFRYGMLYGYLYGWATTWSIAEVGAEYFHLGFPIAMAGFAIFIILSLVITWFAARRTRSRPETSRPSPSSSAPRARRGQRFFGSPRQRPRKTLRRRASASSPDPSY